MNSPFYLSRSYSFKIHDCTINTSRNSRTLANYEVDPCSFKPVLNP